MRKYFLKRIIYMLIALLVVVTVTFFLMRMAPGSPFVSETQEITPEIQERLNDQYGLNEPWYIQYWQYIKNTITFDFGESMKYRGRMTNDMIAESFPVSLTLASVALIVAVVGGILLGVISAMNHNDWPDYVTTLIAIIGISIPSFVLAGIFQYVFASGLGWFPISGWKNLSYAILPAIALGLAYMGNIAKLLRSSLLEQDAAEYVKLAHAKGYKKWQIMWHHTFKNSLLPVITYLGPIIAGVLTGSFVIENIFAIPGLGRHFVTSINNRDYTVIMGITVFFAIVLLSSVLLVDVLTAFLDPRIKLEGESNL